MQSPVARTYTLECEGPIPKYRSLALVYPINKKAEILTQKIAARAKDIIMMYNISSRILLVPFVCITLIFGDVFYTFDHLLHFTTF